VVRETPEQYADIVLPYIRAIPPGTLPQCAPCVRCVASDEQEMRTHTRVCDQSAMRGSTTSSAGSSRTRPSSGTSTLC
jgi:hypothetical protein